MEEIREQFAEVESNIEKDMKETAEIENEIKETLGELLKISESSLATTGEGDEDIMKINFAGRNVDIKRSELTMKLVGWNLFSCLFKKTWDGFHVKDKNGRIYVDLKEEWLRPFIDFMKYTEKDNLDSCINGANSYLIQVMRNFKMKDSFKLYSDESTIIVKGLENSQIGSQLMMKEDFRKQLIADYSLIEDKPLQLDFHLLYSGKKSEPPKNQPVIASDIRYKSILFVVTMKDGKIGWKLDSSAQKPGHNQRKNTRISDFFPLQLHINTYCAWTWPLLISGFRFMK
jgi:hypothetical protein